MKNLTVALSLIALLAALPGNSWSQAPASSEIPRDSTIVQLDTPFVLDRGLWGGHVDVRVFGSDEDIVYTSLALHYGLGSRCEAVARGVFAERKDLAILGGGTLRHGGNDGELAIKFRPGRSSNLAVLAGVSFAGTPAQNDTLFTLGGAAAANLGKGFTVYLNPRAAFIEHNNIVGIGLGFHAQLSPRVRLVGDYTPVVDGDNTRSTTTGARKSTDVFGLALRFGSPEGRFALDLGYTNGTGSTTGFGLTPGLGGSGAFYLAFSVHR